MSWVLGDTMALAVWQQLQLCPQALLQLTALSQEFPAGWEESQVFPEVSIPPSKQLLLAGNWGIGNSSEHSTNDNDLQQDKASLYY